MKRVPVYLRAMRRAVATQGTTVTLTWVERTGGSVDPVTGAMLSPSSESTKTSTVKGLVHFIGASTKLRQYAEIEEGDVLLDLDPSAAIDGKSGLRFTIDGRVYVQKEIGSELSQVWDAVFANHRMLRTVLLRLGT